MSTDRAGKLPPRNQPEMPSYFRKDRVGRDEFLSQLGHFNEEHRALFNRLCDMWEPDLPYSKFFAKAGHEYLNADASLNTLMIHMEKGNCGIISMTAREGQLEKDRIILTDRDSPRFWYWLVENLWQSCRVSERDSFPTVAQVRKRGGFPQDVLQPLSLAEISGSFIEAHSEEVLLYALPDIEGRTLIVTPATLPLMVDAARFRIHGILTDSPLQPVLARFLGTVVSSLRKSLDTTDDAFWHKLADAIIVHREDLLTKKANISIDLFIAAKILKIYTRNVLDEAEHRREQDAEKRDTIQGILGQIARKTDFLMTEKEFDAQFEPYRETWPDLREMFIAHYMRNTGRTGIPAVVSIGEDYVFRDHLYPLFKARHQVASTELREFYLNMIEHILKTNNRDRITAFTGLNAFRDDVKIRLAAEFPVLNEMLTRPRMISEGTIHYASKVLKIADMDRVKSILERYFVSGSIRFKSPEQLFDLPPRLMFENAFRRLSWFRRFVLRMFGRYDSYVQNLRSVEEAAASPTSRSPADRPSPEEYRKIYPGSESVMEAAVRRRKQSGAGRRAYSLKQQDAAWDEFRAAYEKKKGDK